MKQHLPFLKSRTLTCAGLLVALIATSCNQETPAASSQAPAGEAQAGKVPMRDVKTAQVNVSRFHRSIEATGTVAFDQNRSTQVLSPIAGTVVEKLISPGQLLQAGTTACFTVADLSSVWVIANVFEADLPFVKIGDPAEVLTGGGGAPLTGKVSYIAALVDPNTRAISVRLDVPNSGEALKRDMYVRVVIHSKSESEGLLVPVSAVLRDEENLPFVFVAKSDGTFGRQTVQIGSRIGDHQEITSGLTAGQSGGVEGGPFLSTGEPPRAVQTPSGHPPGRG